MEIHKAYNLLLRTSQNLNVMCLWSKNRYLFSKDIDDYLFERDKINVAVYGVGDIGEAIIECLKKSEKINMRYAIDRNPLNCFVDGINIVKLDEVNDEIDAIVVSIVDRFGEIRDEISKRVNCCVISIEEIVYNLGKVNNHD